MNFKKVVVLGSNSFTGAHFIDYVLKNSDAKIIGISRSPEYNPILLPYIYKKNKSNKFTFMQLDVNQDTKKIIEILEREKPEVVVNYTAQGEVRNSWKWPEQWFETNCMGIVKISNYLAQTTYLKKYFNCSTPEVYGSTKKNIKENNNYHPSTPYAASKLAGDLFLETLFKKYNFPVVSTRSANVYGIHQQLFRIIPRTIIYLKMGKKITLHGGGNSLRSFVHVKDVVRATWKVINEGTNGAVYHLAPDNEEIFIKDLVALICEMIGYDFSESIEVIGENFGQDAMYSLDSSKIKNELSWTPAISLKEGIQEMIEWIDDNWEEVKEMPLEYIHKV
jgi:dTDP-glucose 4,6-dehydratase